MKKLLLTGAVFMLLITCNSGQQAKKDSAGESSNIIYLTDQSFKELVFNYDASKDLKYIGTKPAIIDFYADWCAPCRTLSPMLEDLAKKYSNEIVLYKIDTEKEKKLTEAVGITGLPTVFYIPLNGRPQVRLGLVPKDSIEQTIKEVLLNK